MVLVEEYYIDQWNMTEKSRNRPPHICSTDFIFDKDTKPINRIKIVFSTNGAGVMDIYWQQQATVELLAHGFVHRATSII